MGLNTTHDCWHGAYSAFMRWRAEIAKTVGIPLRLMEGFYSDQEEQTLVGFNASKSHADYVRTLLSGVPVPWSVFKPDVLHVLLHHPDYEGIIEHHHCAPLADRLTKLLPLLPTGDGGGHIGNWRDKTQTFIDGLRAAHEAGEDVGFH